MIILFMGLKIYASSEYTRGKDTGLFDIVKKIILKRKYFILVMII